MDALKSFASKIARDLPTGPRREPLATILGQELAAFRAEAGGATQADIGGIQVSLPAATKAWVDRYPVVDEDLAKMGVAIRVRVGLTAASEVNAKPARTGADDGIARRIGLGSSPVEPQASATAPVLTRSKQSQTMLTVQAQPGSLVEATLTAANKADKVVQHTADRHGYVQLDMGGYTSASVRSRDVGGTWTAAATHGRSVPG